MLKIDTKKVLVVLAGQNKNVYLSARNLPNAKVMTTNELNTYALMNSNAVILVEDSLDAINKL